MQMNKIGDGAFQPAQTRPALPAGGQVSPNLRVFPRIQLAIGGENQLLIGKMTIFGKLLGRHG
jgi:hypothetical protein